MPNRNSFKVMIVTLCTLTFGIGVPGVLAKPIDNYFGIGARMPLQDPLSLIINAKFKIVDFGGVSFSGRPAIFLGEYTESRFSLTGEMQTGSNWAPFLGAGLATNTDRSGETNSMVSAGVDIGISEKLVFSVGGNWIFQADDNDREVNVTLNYLF